MADLDPRFTLGDLAQQRDQVLRRLAADGSLDANGRRRAEPGAAARRRRRPAPAPRRGTTSTTSCVRSGFGFQLVLADTRVQGPEAGAAR